MEFSEGESVKRPTASKPGKGCEVVTRWVGLMDGATTGPTLSKIVG